MPSQQRPNRSLFPRWLSSQLPPRTVVMIPAMDIAIAASDPRFSFAHARNRSISLTLCFPSSDSGTCPISSFASSMARLATSTAFCVMSRRSSSFPISRLSFYSSKIISMCLILSSGSPFGIATPFFPVP